MSATGYKEAEHPDKGESGKKPFIEPELKEFDDLEKQIKSSSLIGTWTP